MVPRCYKLSPSVDPSTTHPDESCKHGFSTYLALLCGCPPPAELWCRPCCDSAFQLQVLKARNHCATPTPSLCHHPPPTMQCNHLLSMFNQRSGSTLPSMLTKPRPAEEMLSLSTGQTDVYYLSAVKDWLDYFGRRANVSHNMFELQLLPISPSPLNTWNVSPSTPLPHLQKSQGSSCQVAVNR